MADESTSSRDWLPPSAPGAEPPPRFDAPEWQRPEHTPAPPPVTPATWSPAPAQRRPAAEGPVNPPARWSLGLGITGLTGLVLSLGTLFLFTLPCSIAAWVLGARARGRVRRGETARGEGQAVAGLWIGRIGVVAGVAFMLAWVVLALLGYTVTDLSDDLREWTEEQRRNGR